MDQTTSSKNVFSNIRFNLGELLAIEQVLRHSTDFGQSVAPPDVVSGILQKIQNHKPLVVTIGWEQDLKLGSK
ncbi:hypothetical protein [uncultured Mediterranean phage uvMED]|nr:hypothetical protein [uncultured Mediterranean phage uvMED]